MVTAINCSNCGGILNDRLKNCPYCSALLIWGDQTELIDLSELEKLLLSKNYDEIISKSNELAESLDKTLLVFKCKLLKSLKDRNLSAEFNTLSNDLVSKLSISNISKVEEFLKETHTKYFKSFEDPSSSGSIHIFTPLAEGIVIFICLLSASIQSNTLLEILINLVIKLDFSSNTKICKHVNELLNNKNFILQNKLNSFKLSFFQKQSIQNKIPNISKLLN